MSFSNLFRLVQKNALGFAAFFFVGCGSNERLDLGKYFTKPSKSLVETFQLTSKKISGVNSKDKKTLEKSDVKAAELGVTPPSTASVATVTLNKNLLKEVFLYGADLQYSSSADPNFELISQSTAIGHVPATFRLLGDKLQLLADQRRLFESQVNHPELLIAEFKVINETEDTLTVAFEHGGIVLNETVNGKGSKAPKQTWLRSLSFDPNGNYLLYETAILLDDGSVQTYLESVFPRQSLISEDDKGIEANPDTEDLAERYRFLSNEEVYIGTGNGEPEVRRKTSFASRFKISGNKTIDWYVTPNIPDKFLPVMKSGVEGWNRYFRVQEGRDVVRFLGKLPEGIKLGDPRYNVINFDTVAEAGAAYESQAADPLTGIQSHSLIYMPYAWYNIGAKLWKKRSYSETASQKSLLAAISPKNPEVLFGSNRSIVRCAKAGDMMGLPSHLMLEAMTHEGEGLPASVDQFAQRLMISTLFHEVGHALGLAHNFKGSLAFDGTVPTSESNPTSWSVMDYNYFQHEMDLVKEIGDTNGPIMEYDRQIISQLYNGGKFVKEEDPVIPACADDEADARGDETDPLCVRYDSEKDPSKSLVHAFEKATLVTSAGGIETQTLAVSLNRLADFSKTKIATPDATMAETLDTVVKLANQTSDLTSYYLISGAQSLKAHLVNGEKMVRQWGDDKTPEELSEKTLRSTYWGKLTTVASWNTLPEVPNQSLELLVSSVKEAVLAHPNSGDSAEEKEQTAQKFADTFRKTINEKLQGQLSALRRDIYKTLAFDKDSPFALSVDGEVFSFEDQAANILKSAVILGLDKDADEISKFSDERVQAAKSLKSFESVLPLNETVNKLDEYIAKGKLTGNNALVIEGRNLKSILLKADK